MFVGCCGFPVSKREYLSRFHLVEVQQTFYQIPREKTLRKWRGEVPKDFEFIVKAWQGITHPITSLTWKRFRGELVGAKENYGNLKYTEEVMDAWREMLKAMDILKSNKILIQLPPKLKWNNVNKEEVTSTLTEFSRSGKYIVVEPRHVSWWNDEVKRMFDDLGIIHCIDPFKHDEINIGGFCYFRLHGRDGYNYSYKYSEEDFRSLFNKIMKIDERDCYIMFNNKYMYKDALSFRKILIDNRFNVY